MLIIYNVYSLTNWFFSLKDMFCQVLQSFWKKLRLWLCVKFTKEDYDQTFWDKSILDRTVDLFKTKAKLSIGNDYN